MNWRCLKKLGRPVPAVWLAMLVLAALLTTLTLRRWHAPRADAPPPAQPGAASPPARPAPMRVYALNTPQVTSNLVYLAGSGYITGAATNLPAMFQDFFSLAGCDFKTHPPSTKRKLYDRVPAPFKGLARNLFANLGVDLATNPPPRSQLFFHAPKGLLMLRATASDLEIVEQALRMFGPRTNIFDGIEPEDMAAFKASMSRGSRYAKSAPVEERPRPVRLPDAVETVVCRIIDPEWFRAKLLRGTRARAGTFEETQRLLREFFACRGVDFDAATARGPKCLLYNDRNGMLLVRTTRREIERVERVVIAHNDAAFAAQMQKDAATATMPPQ